MLAGQSRGGSPQIRIEKTLDARIDGAEGIAQQLVFPVEAAQQRTRYFEEIRIGRSLADRLAQRGEFQVDVPEQFVGLGLPQQEKSG